MGTDIFMYSEYRQHGRWALCEPLEPNPWHEDVPEDPEFKPKEVYDERNYSLFAILADIRNPSHGWTGYRFIAKPRGLPSDISPELMQ